MVGSPGKTAMLADKSRGGQRGGRADALLRSMGGGAIMSLKGS
ncbi:hypothetical protein C4K27_4066 [Pseudomonas chlororaphis subsp. chlororaphis]|nr:hypothetical protein C4K27_4066 [Pseudomonas chlororaphis subsp. chlororaphis]